MSVSDAQKRAKIKYEKEKVRQVIVKFYPTEKELLEHLESKGNMSGYIKDLIKRDLDNGQADVI